MHGARNLLISQISASKKLVCKLLANEKTVSENNE